MKLVKATNDDRYFLSTVCQDAASIYREILPGAFEKQGKKYLDGGIPTSYEIEIIEENHQKIGFIGTKKLDVDSLYLTALYLLTEYQRRGYGEAVLTTLEGIAREEGLEEILLLVHQEAHWAINFYCKNGFESITDHLELKEYKESKMASYIIPSTLLMRKNLK